MGTDNVPEDERRVNLVVWAEDGCLDQCRGLGRDLPDISVGRTASKRGLGFKVEVGKEPAWNTTGKYVTFVLDRAQVEALRDFLAYSVPRLRKSTARAGAAR